MQLSRWRRDRALSCPSAGHRRRCRAGGKARLGVLPSRACSHPHHAAVQLLMLVTVLGVALVQSLLLRHRLPRLLWPCALLMPGRWRRPSGMPSGTLSIHTSVCQCHGTQSQCCGVQTITANCSMEAVCRRCSTRPAAVPEGLRACASARLRRLALCRQACPHPETLPRHAVGPTLLSRARHGPRGEVGRAGSRRYGLAGRLMQPGSHMLPYGVINLFLSPPLVLTSSADHLGGRLPRSCAAKAQSAGAHAAVPAADTGAACNAL